MKKVVRAIRIGILSGLAFLVACTSHQGLSRSERKQLKSERTALVKRIDEQSKLSSDNKEELITIRQYELSLRNRLSEIDRLLGNQTSVDENMGSIYNLVDEIDSIEQARKAEIDSIRKAKRHTPQPCVYGPPR